MVEAAQLLEECSPGQKQGGKDQLKEELAQELPRESHSPQQSWECGRTHRNTHQHNLPNLHDDCILHT